MKQGRPMRAVCILVALLAGVTSLVPVSAQVDERLVKAEALVKVPLFVEWPVTTAERFVIGVAADDDFAGLIARAAQGRRLHDREIHVRRVSADQACECQLLFVSSGEDPHAGTLLRSNRGRAVLTIGETTAFLRAGGIVRIFRDEDRLRLQINKRGAENAGLRISSRLLQLAIGTS